MPKSKTTGPASVLRCSIIEQSHKTAKSPHRTWEWDELLTLWEVKTEVSWHCAPIHSKYENLVKQWTSRIARWPNDATLIVPDKNNSIMFDYVPNLKWSAQDVERGLRAVLSPVFKFAHEEDCFPGAAPIDTFRVSYKEVRPENEKPMLSILCRMVPDYGDELHFLYKNRIRSCKVHRKAIDHRVLWRLPKRWISKDEFRGGKKLYGSSFVIDLGDVDPSTVLRDTDRNVGLHPLFSDVLFPREEEDLRIDSGG